MRVLLIEDDSTMAKSIELILSAEGFNTYTTDMGEEGLDLGKLYDYDIIVLDLNLPDISGYEVLRKLRTARIDTPIDRRKGSGSLHQAKARFRTLGVPALRKAIT
jgi:two-component system cell cycle response regulator CtrA